MFNIKYLEYFSAKLYKLTKTILEEITMHHSIVAYSNFKIFGADIIE
jgi:hypothetical protein